MRRFLIAVSLCAIILPACSSPSYTKAPWESTQVTGGIQYEMTKMYLDLRKDGTFIAQFEGPDAGGSPLSASQELLERHFAVGETYVAYGKLRDLFRRLLRPRGLYYSLAQLRKNGPIPTARDL